MKKIKVNRGHPLLPVVVPQHQIYCSLSFKWQLSRELTLFKNTGPWYAESSSFCELHGDLRGSFQNQSVLVIENWSWCHCRILKSRHVWWPRAKSWFFSRYKGEEKSAGRNFKQDWRPRWAMQCHTPSTIKRYKQTPPARYRRFTEIMQTFISLLASVTSRWLPALESGGWVRNSDNGLVHAWSVQIWSLGSPSWVRPCSNPGENSHFLSCSPLPTQVHGKIHAFGDVVTAEPLE